jgi:hypothetical protein
MLCLIRDWRFMSYEHPTEAGIARLLPMKNGWAVQYNGRRRGQWTSPDAAARAMARHKTGLADWDRRSAIVSDDLLDWRPLGESL